MLLERGAPHRHQVHDREDAGLLEVALFLGAIVRKQPDHGAARRERIRRAGRDHRVDLAARQHGVEAGLRAAFVAHARREIERHLLHPAGFVDAGLQPANLGEIDAVFLGQEATHVDAGGLRPFGNSDGAAFQILRGPDAAVAAHIDRGMAMHAGGKYRDRHHPGGVLRGERDVLAERKLGDVPFHRAGEAEGDLLDRREDQRGERDAVGANDALRDLAHVLVVGDRQREMHERGAAAGDDLRTAQVGRAAVGGRLGGHVALPERCVRRRATGMPSSGQAPRDRCRTGSRRRCS